MVETEHASVTLREKLAEAESAASILRDEKATAACSVDKIIQELEHALEQKRASVAQLDALRDEQTAMVGYVTLLIQCFIVLLQHCNFQKTS